MRIAQISDIHIRNLKFHSDYRKTFKHLYQKLEEVKADLTVNTGDTAHTKTNISPEFVDITSELCVEIAKRTPLINILGNHDLNLMNEDRQDAITPIVQALNSPRIFLLKESREYTYDFAPGFAFHNFGISDTKHWTPGGPYNQDLINIGLFHGSVRNCITDSLFRMTHVEYDTDIFEGLDFVMMGDIHKRQWFNDKRVWYAGSLIQQNFGEEPDKGFLLWDIKSRDDFTVEFHELKGARKFYTISLGADLKIPEVEIEPDSRLRISPPRPLTLVEQKTVEKLVKRKYAPHDVMTLGAQNIGQMFVQAAGKDQKIENLRDVSVQEQLLREYLALRSIKAEVVDRVVALNKKYQAMVEQKEDMARGVNWKVLKLGWNNLYNYGEGNLIDFSQIKGLTGIFAPNASGKSGMIDAITVGMFDSNTKEVMKNIHLVNDNKDKCAIIMELLANNERYTVQREIERIKFVRKGQAQEWGKTTLDFVRNDRDGGVERLVQESRPDTEKQIRRRFGSFEDFMLTALFAQWDPMDLIMCKETDRKRILFRFLDLDIFEEKAKLAKEDAKEWLDKLADLEEGGYEAAAKELEEKIEATREEIEECEQSAVFIEKHIKNLHDRVQELSEKKAPVREVREVTQEQVEELEQQMARTSKPLTDLLAKHEELGQQVKELAYLDHSDVEHLKEAVDKLYERKQELFAVQASLKECKKSLEGCHTQTSLLKTVPCGDQFPTCKYLTNAFKAKETIPTWEKAIAEKEELVTKLAAEVKELMQSERELVEHEDKQEKYTTLKTSRAMTQLKIENVQLSVDKLKGDIEKAKEAKERFERVKASIESNRLLDEEIAETKGAINARTRHLKETQATLVDLNKKLGSDQGILERISTQLAKLKDIRETYTSYEHFLDAMGKDGIALQVLTQKLPVINEEINKILGSTTEFGVYIEYGKDDQSIRLYLQYGQYKSRLLELGSGAEKFLASVAIRAALLSISNLPRSNMFIIDEGFGKLDPQNMESIQRMFDYLRSVFDHVIVISHTDVMKDMVDNIIDITTDDEGYAHVEIGG